jgi:GT2 family glycosyltransferase
LVEKIGYFDENYYPAYYEDDDYAIRVHHSGMKAIRFNDTALLHGELDGSLDYLSGIFSYLYLTPKEKITSSLKIWKKTFEYGKNIL